VPIEVVNDYKKKYAKVTDISHPAETNGLEKISVYQENPMRIRQDVPVSPFLESNDRLPS
jgi:hypothetical protein